MMAGKESKGSLRIRERRGRQHVLEKDQKLLRERERERESEDRARESEREKEREKEAKTNRKREREREKREREREGEEGKENFGKSVCGSTQVLSSWACADFGRKSWLTLTLQFKTNFTFSTPAASAA